MSFGSSVGDVLIVSKLAFDLYTKWAPAVRHAPRDFELLIKELGSLRLTFEILENEVQSPDSFLTQAGRADMFRETLGRVKETLQELQKFAQKNGSLGDGDKRKRDWKRWWSGIKWAIQAPDLDAIRNKARDTESNGELMVADLTDIAAHISQWCT